MCSVTPVIKYLSTGNVQKILHRSCSQSITFAMNSNNTKVILIILKSSFCIREKERSHTGPSPVNKVHEELF